MRQNLIDFDKFKITYSVGHADILNNMVNVPALIPFSDTITDFLNALSKNLLSKPQTKAYPDVMTLAFWMRKASMIHLKNRFVVDDLIRLGRGVVFHIAPSNVAVNYAYSFITGLVCGNANVVRLPSKDFAQVDIINNAINEVLEVYPNLKPYIALVHYGHDNAINDAMSAMADVRVIWGGDNTITEIRNSPLKARAAEITFADRYSLAVIDADTYLKIDNKSKVAIDFWNDTYLSDQNACTSPRVILWLGEKKEEAKAEFWHHVNNLVEKQYEIYGVQVVNKLTSRSLLAVAKDGVKVEHAEDNLITRVHVEKLDVDLMEFKDNSGYFIECDGESVFDLKDICNDSRCQTISYIGDKHMFKQLLTSGISGVDRVVPMGKTMDFDFIWDGNNLFERMTRTIAIS